MAVPLNHLPLTEGVAPDGKTPARFYVDRDELDLLMEEGPEAKYEETRFLFEAVEEPDAIFRGLRRYGQNESYCYSAQLTRDPDDPSGGPPRYGYVFLAFARPEAWGFLVFWWEFREEDPDCPGHPEGWEADFERPSWRKT